MIQDTNTISLLFRVLAGMISILSMPMLIEYITEIIKNDFVNINGIELTRCVRIVVASSEIIKQ